MSEETASTQHDGRRGPGGRGSSGGERAGAKRRDGLDAGGAGGRQARSGSGGRRRRLRGADRRRTNKGRYRIVWVSLWGDEKFRRLQDDGKLLWLYLLTGPVVTTLPGLFAAGRAQLAEALRWSVERFDDAFAELERARMATADWDAQVVFLPNAIKHNAPPNPNTVLSYRAYWDEIPECALKIAGLEPIIAHLMTCPESFRDAFARTFADVPLPFPERFANGSANQEQDQDQDQDQDQEKESSRAQRGGARAHAREGGGEDPGGEGEASVAPPLAPTAAAASSAPPLAPTAAAILAELQARPRLRDVAEPAFATVLGEMVDSGQQTLERALRALREGEAKQAVDQRPPRALKAFLVGCVTAGPLGRPGPAAAELPEASPAEAALVLDVYAEAWSRRYGAYCEDPDGADRATAGRLAAKARRMAPEPDGASPDEPWVELVRFWIKRFLREEEHSAGRHRLDLIHKHLQRFRTPWHERMDRERRLAQTRPEEHQVGPRFSVAPPARRMGGEVPPPPELRSMLERLDGVARDELQELGADDANADASAA
ncbi:hypothetical protein WME90_01845 [Sorangium sp. So ce375]|uniref:hypothetical protein n=1 Tax=Sorangium sp. So ce375 TaxID=3133306 RepID=UPI003F5B0B83